MMSERLAAVDEGVDVLLGHVTKPQLNRAKRSRGCQPFREKFVQASHRDIGRQVVHGPQRSNHPRRARSQEGGRDSDRLIHRLVALRDAGLAGGCDHKPRAGTHGHEFRCGQLVSVGKYE